MNKPKFTQGPLIADDTVVYDSEKHTIAHCFCKWPLSEDDETVLENVRANAVLFASAPEMYDLLFKIFTATYETIDDSGDAVTVIPKDVFNGILPMLKKARGEQ